MVSGFNLGHEKSRIIVSVHGDEHFASRALSDIFSEKSYKKLLNHFNISSMEFFPCILLFLHFLSSAISHQLVDSSAGLGCLDSLAMLGTHYARHSHEYAVIQIK